MQQPQGSPVANFLPLILILVIFYFLLIRPQKKSQLEHQKVLKNLKKNDEVVTNGGVHGKIINVKDKTLVLRIDENVKIEVDKNCIAYLQKGSKE